MLHIDPFTVDDYRALAAKDGEAAAIYLPTTPLSHRVNENRIAFKNLARQALDAAARLDFASVDALAAAFAAIEGDYAFWSNQAHGLATLAFNGEIKTLRLAYPVSQSVEVGARLHLKPLLPALHPKRLWVLAISDDGAQLHRLLANRTLERVEVPGMPVSLRDEMGELIDRKRGESDRLTSGEGYLVRQREYLKAIHDAVEPVIRDSNAPLVLVATQEHVGEYGALNAYPSLVGAVERSPSDTPHETILDRLDAIEQEERRKRLARWEDVYKERQDDRRTVSETQQISRLLTAGQIESLLVSHDEVKYGSVARDGTVEFAEGPGPGVYDVYDDIVRRALDTGVTILPVRSDEKAAARLHPLAATLRWPQ